MAGEITSVLASEACAFPPGLFHHAKIFNGLVYCAGQVGGDISGKLVSEDVKEQTMQMFKNIEAIVKAAGSSLDRILKVNIYMVDKADYAALNEVYKEMMPDPKPPRACVFVAGLPGGAKVEMECVAAQK